MNNREIAHVLERIALLLNMEGSNPFKIRAFERAARIISSFDGSIQDMTRWGELQSIEGIGKGIASEVEALVNTGESPALQELSQRFPPSIFEIVEVPGVGPRKAVQLYRELGIDSLEDLERAARGGLTQKLKGFGSVTEQNILMGIILRMQAMEQKSIGTALPIARQVMQDLLENSSLEQLSEGGDLRRRTETVGRIELVGSAGLADPILDQLAQLDGIEKIHSRKATSILVENSDGIEISLQVADPHRYGLALLLSTGSSPHTLRIKNMLNQGGYIIRNGGLYNSSDSFVPTPDEETLYQLAGLPFIPPQVRNTGQEVDEYLANPALQLIQQSDIRGDMQMHSHFSDGIASIEEMARSARQKGYSYIAITDHSGSLVIANGVKPERKIGQHQEIHRVNSLFDGEFKIFKAAEVDILSDGSLDYPDELLEQLDFVLISIHSAMKMSEEKMTSRLVRAIRHPRVHCLAHPSGRLINRRPEMNINWDRVFEAALDAGIALEINSHPYRLDLDEHRCRTARDMGIPLFINTDAHSPEELDMMEFGVSIAQRGWIRKEDVVNTLPPDRLLEWLKSK